MCVLELKKISKQSVDNGTQVYHWQKRSSKQRKKESNKPCAVRPGAEGSLNSGLFYIHTDTETTKDTYVYTC